MSGYLTYVDCPIWPTGELFSQLSPGPGSYRPELLPSKTEVTVRFAKALRREPFEDTLSPGPAYDCRGNITDPSGMAQVCCNKVKRLSWRGSMNHVGIRLGGRGGRGEGKVEGRSGGGGEVGERRGRGEGGGEVGGGGGEEEGRGGRGIRMNHGAFSWGGLHFVTAEAQVKFTRQKRWGSTIRQPGEKEEFPDTGPGTYNTAVSSIRENTGRSFMSGWKEWDKVGRGSCGPTREVWNGSRMAGRGTTFVRAAALFFEQEVKNLKLL